MEYIYLIRTYGKDKSLVKLGYSSDVKSRLSQYLYANPLYEVLQIYTVENAFQFEKDFHSKYPASFGNEWYEEELLPTMIKEIESQIHEIYDLTPAPKITFKDVVEECKKGNREYLALAFEKYDFLEEAITKIGFKGIEESKYSISNVKSKIIRLSTGSDKQKIFQHLKNSSYIYEGGFVELKTLKNLFTKIYADLNIKVTPKAIDIQNYYHTKDYTKTIKVIKTVEGLPVTTWKSVKGFVISKAKL
jgi:hypothetical protein